MKPPELISVVTLLLVIFLVLLHELFWLFCVLRKKPLRPGKTRNIVHCIFIAGFVLLLYALFIEPYWLDVKHVEITTKKLTKANFTIVQISDLHCDLQKRAEEKLVRLVNAIQPDIIAFTGDAVNSPEALPSFKDTLKRLRASLGKVGVKGNWDVWYWQGMDTFSGTDFNELSGETVSFFKNGEKLSVIGFNPDQPVDLRALSRLPSEAYTILLYHFPGLNEETGEVPIDLFLSGHTHGGQVALPFYGALVTSSRYGKKYESGAYTLGKDQMLYVNRGIGMEGGIAPRLRFFSRPEITVFHIKPESQTKI
jgi:predicted MPP superfamily phosphohydrolase